MVYYPNFFSINNNNMDYLTNTFEDDIKSEFIEYYANCFGNRRRDEANMERFLEIKYKTLPLTKYKYAKNYLRKNYKEIIEEALAE